MYIFIIIQIIKKWDLFYIMNIVIELFVVWFELDFVGFLLMVVVFLGVRGSFVDGWLVLVEGDCQGEGSLLQRSEVSGSQEWQRIVFRYCCIEGVLFGFVLLWWLVGIQGRCVEGQIWYCWVQLEEYRSKRSEIVSFINIDIFFFFILNFIEVINLLNLIKVKSFQSISI